MITVNMGVAREIHRTRIREARKGVLESLDVSYMRAQEAGDDTSAIVAKKVLLRDLPADHSIESASTPEQLKATWPTALLGKSPYLP